MAARNEHAEAVDRDEEVGLMSDGADIEPRGGRTDNVETTSNSYIRKCGEQDITICCVNTWRVGSIIAITFAGIWAFFLLLMILIPMPTVRAIILGIEPNATGLFPADGNIVTPSCAFTWSNVSSHFNIFLFFHWLRYFVMAFIWRTRAVLWVHSICWEVMEYTLFHVAAFQLNGSECWWDSLFFDIFGMNMLGIEIGLLLLNQTRLLTLYQPTLHGILFSKPCSLYGVLIIAVFILMPLLEETFVFTSFVIALWFQTLSHWLVYYRSLCVFGLNALYAANQVYYFVQHPAEARQKESKGAQLKRLYFVFILVVLCLLEAMLTVKGYVHL